MTKFIEVCSGVGGTRLGLERLAWNCAYSCDIDPQAAEVHRLAFGDCEVQDALDIDPATLPKADILVAGFPCQPFSSSGNRSGFSHRRGNVFNAIERIIRERKPRAVILENVQGLLSNRNGHSMACILKSLTSAGYYAEWVLVNASSVGLPHDRPRLFIVAIDNAKHFEREAAGGAVALQIFSALQPSIIGMGERAEKGSLMATIREREPRVGVAAPTGRMPFNTCGYVYGDKFVTFKSTAVRSLKPYKGLAAICAPDFHAPDAIRSVRYWGHDGSTKPYRKKDPLSHCIGTNIGAGPTFCIPSSFITGSEDYAAATHFANWTRVEKDLLVFRLTPERALQLFDKTPSRLARAFRKSSLGITKRYELLGNMVAPDVARVIGRCVEASLRSA